MMIYAYKRKAAIKIIKNKSNKNNDDNNSKQDKIRATG